MIPLPEPKIMSHVVFGYSQDQMVAYGDARVAEALNRKPLTDDEFDSLIESSGVPIEDVQAAYAIKDLLEVEYGIKEQS